MQTSEIFRCLLFLKTVFHFCVQEDIEGADNGFNLIISKEKRIVFTFFAHRSGRTMSAEQSGGIRQR